MLGVTEVDALPHSDRVEIAFAGRSNVGKSSLLNALLARRSLARVSNTPGRTRELNYFSVGDRLYAGEVGQGATLEHQGERRALAVSDTAQPSALRLLVSRSHRSKETDQVVSGLGIGSERPSGSVGLKVGLIAEREADLYVHMSGHASLWDSCGPEAILVAAGGRFTDLFGTPIDYRSVRMKNARGLLACNAAAFDAVLPVVSAAAAQGGLG